MKKDFTWDYVKRLCKTDKQYMFLNLHTFIYTIGTVSVFFTLYEQSNLSLSIYLSTCQYLYSTIDNDYNTPLGWGFWTIYNCFLVYTVMKFQYPHKKLTQSNQVTKSFI